MFFFKRKTVTLDCFTSRPEVFNFAPVQKAIKFIPQWWKDLPIFKDGDVVNTQRNMRYCPGIIEFYRKGIVIPMWSDLRLGVAPKGDTQYLWQFSDGRSEVEVHTPDQWGNFLNPAEYQHFKLSSPWVFKTNRYIQFASTQPTWNMSNPEKFIVFNAVDNFYYQTSTTINMLVARAETPKEILIPFLHPLINLLPMTEENVELKTHLVTPEEYDRIQKSTYYLCTFSKSYYTCKHMREKS